MLPRQSYIPDDVVRKLGYKYVAQGSTKKIVAYLVWLPLAAISPLLFVNSTEVYARVFPTM